MYKGFVLGTLIAVGVVMVLGVGVAIGLVVGDDDGVTVQELAQGDDDGGAGGEPEQGEPEADDADGDALAGLDVLEACLSDAGLDLSEGLDLDELSIDLGALFGCLRENADQLGRGEGEACLFGGGPHSFAIPEELEERFDGFRFELDLPESMEELEERFGGFGFELPEDLPEDLQEWFEDLELPESFGELREELKERFEGFEGRFDFGEYPGGRFEPLPGDAEDEPANA